MEDVRFYDFDFNLLHIEHDIFSCNWMLYENDIGTFEMHFPLQSQLAEVMMEHRYLVAVQGEKQAIITGRQLGTEGVVYGRTCNWLLTRFCVADAFDTDALLTAGEILTADAESVCAYVVQKGMGDLLRIQTDEETVFSAVQLANQSVTSVFDLVQECMKSGGGGHRVVFDVPQKCWIFQVTKGKELPSVFSETDRNICQTVYTEDLQDFFTGGWYKQAVEHMGEWNASGNVPTLRQGRTENFAKSYRINIEGEQFGINFAEGDYIICKDKNGNWEKADNADDFYVQIPSNETGLLAWMDFLDGETEAEAKQSLGERCVMQELTAKMCGLLYGKDYQLGDVVCVDFVKGDFRKHLHRKISGVRLWYEENDIGEEPIMEEAEA